MSPSNSLSSNLRRPGESRILFQMSGSIACFKACLVISKLVQAGHAVQVVASKAALQFIGAATLEGLTGRPVVSDLYEPGNMMDHIRYVRWADLILAAPATAHLINRLAQGVGDDLLTTQFLAHDFQKPYLIAPAMNTAMYLHPITQASIQTLKSMKVEILETASGVLACGEVGWGRLLDPDLIVNEVESRLTVKNVFPKALDSEFPAKSGFNGDLPRLLVTSGGTSEAVDSVRVLTNRSSGATGANIAETLLQFGFAVTYVHSLSAHAPLSDCPRLGFESFTDLKNILESELSQQKYCGVIHAAAVSDFSPALKVEGKISSDSDFEIKMKRNPKLVNHLREMAKNPELQVVAFKMTACSANGEQMDEQKLEQRKAVQKLFSHSKADLVVQNDLSEIDSVSGKHRFHIFQKDLTERTLDSNSELGFFLGQYFNQFLTSSLQQGSKQ